MWGFIETIKSNLDDAAGLSKGATGHLHLPTGTPFTSHDQEVVTAAVPPTSVKADVIVARGSRPEPRDVDATTQSAVAASEPDSENAPRNDHIETLDCPTVSEASEDAAPCPSPVPLVAAVTPETSPQATQTPIETETQLHDVTTRSATPQRDVSSDGPQASTPATGSSPTPQTQTLPTMTVVGPTLLPPAIVKTTSGAKALLAAGATQRQPSPPSAAIRSNDAEMAELRALLEAERAVSAQLRSEGQSIAQRAGLDRERHRAALAERTRLEGEVTVLKRTIEEQTERLTMGDERMRTQDAIIRKLEADMSALERSLTERLDAGTALARAAEAQQQRDADAATQMEALRGAMREAEVRHSAALAAAASERDALLLQVRRQALASEQRAAGLEREIAAMERRADEAEQRALEASSGLLDAAGEWGARVRQLEGQVEAAAARQRAHHTEMEQMAAAVLTAQREAKALRDEAQSGSADAARAHAAATELQQQGEQARARCSALEAALGARESELHAALQSHAAEVAKLQRELAEARAAARAAAAAARLTVAAPALSLTQTAGTAAPVIPASAAAAAPGTRVEKELARVTAQVNDEREKRASAEAALAKLRLEHDVLLQMHGQLIEEFEAGAAVVPAAVSSESPVASSVA